MLPNSLNSKYSIKDKIASLFLKSKTQYESKWFKMESSIMSDNGEHFCLLLKKSQSKEDTNLWKFVTEKWEKEVSLWKWMDTFSGKERIYWPFISNNWEYIFSLKLRTEKGPSYSVLIINWEIVDIKDFSYIEMATYWKNDWRLVYKYVTQSVDSHWNCGKLNKYIRYNNSDIKLFKPNLNLSIWEIYDNWLLLLAQWYLTIRLFLTKKYIVETKLVSTDNVTYNIDTNNILLRSYSSDKRPIFCKIIGNSVEINWKLFSTKVIFPNIKF